MIGFFFGVLFTMGAVGIARRRRRYWGHHHHGGCHGGHGGHGGSCHHRHRHGRWHGHGYGHGYGGGFDDDGWGGEGGWARARGPLGGLFARLQTTPAQEREIREAIADVKKSARGAKGRLKDLSEDLASAMRQEDLDAETLGTLLASQDSAVDDVKKELVGALARVHNVLDKEQRERLARFLERMGPRARWA